MIMHSRLSALSSTPNNVSSIAKLGKEVLLRTVDIQSYHSLVFRQSTNTWVIVSMLSKLLFSQYLHKLESFNFHLTKFKSLFTILCITLNWKETNNNSFVHLLVRTILLNTVWLLILYCSSHVTADVGDYILDKIN